MDNNTSDILLNENNGSKWPKNIHYLVNHKEVSSPAEEHILKLENRENGRISLNLSDKFEDFDKNENICHLYYCILKPNASKKTENNNLLLKLSMELISEEFMKELNRKWKLKSWKKWRVWSKKEDYQIAENKS